MTKEMFVPRLKSFLHAAASFTFPIGVSVEIPIVAELDLISPFLQGEQIDDALLAGLREEVGRGDAYRLATFSTRMAVHSVRKGDVRFLEESFWGLCIDNDFIDWRDLLAVLAIIDDCYSRLNGDFSALVGRYLHLTVPSKKQTIVDGYLTRSLGMRRVEVMGFKATTNERGELAYVRDN